MTRNTTLRGLFRASLLLAGLTPTILAQRVITPVSQSPGTARDFPSVRVDFGSLSCEVPQGWSAVLALGEISSGAFGILARDPNGRIEVRFAHNWNVFMDSQVGGYLPGNQVIERVLLPQYAQEIRPYQVEGVLWRSQNQRELFSDPALAAYGVQIPADSGTLIFAVRHPRGERLIGTAFAKTVRVYEHPAGLVTQADGISLVNFSALTVAPAEEAGQRFAGRVLENMICTLNLSGQYVQAWHNSFQAGQAIARDYSETVSRIVNEGYASRMESQDRNDEQWAIYMRGGQYGQDPLTGDNHWITNDHNYWFVDTQGHVVGNDTGDVPTYQGNWRQLTPIGN
jgi:hypothetical protein